MLTAFAAVCIAVALVGLVAALVEIVAVRAFRRAGTGTTSNDAGATTGVTILKPLHGAEPGLDENLMSFVQQDHAGPVQLLFGVADANDDAVAAVRLLQAACPDRDIELVVTGMPAEGNAKIANLAGLRHAIRHEMVVVSDSDIRVEPAYLIRTLASLARPGVGLVTWLYRGEATGGLWSRLSAMAIDYQFFPSVLLGLRTGRSQPCVGATMALSLSTLDAIGGFEAFARHLADDNAIGQAVGRRGQAVVAAPGVVVHRCLERSAAEMLEHELRWARTIRGIDPLGYIGSIVLHPLPFAIVAALLPDTARLGIAVLLATLLCRFCLQWQVDRGFGRSRGHSLAGIVLGPLRDILSFGVFCASFLVNAVVWRGKRYRIRRDGTMAELKGSRS